MELVNTESKPEWKEDKTAHKMDTTYFLQALATVAGSSFHIHMFKLLVNYCIIIIQNLRQNTFLSYLLGP